MFTQLTGNLKAKRRPKKKGFRAIDIVLFTFSAVFVLDSLGLSTTIGWSSILWWIILGVIFFLPYGLITAELSTTYTQGGIYEWVKRGLGFKNGARTNFFYWVNVAFWMPSVYLILGSTLMYSIDATLLENDWFIWVNVAIAIAVTWITLFFNSIDLEKAKWMPNIGAIIKGFLVVMMIVAMIVFLVDPNLFGSQNEFSGIFPEVNNASGYIATDPLGETGGIVPNFGSTLGIIGIIVYNLCGFELSQNLGGDIKEVKKSVPKALLIGGITILISYIIASIPVFITNNTTSDGYQNTGYQNTIITTLLSGLPKEFVIVLAVLLAFTLFTNMITWTMGANGAMSEAAESKQFQALFAEKNKHGAPFMSALILTLISNVAILVSGLMEFFGAGSAYYILFSFSMIIFFLPYIMIFISYGKLRVLDKGIERPFGIKNDLLAKTLGKLCLVIVIIACMTQVLEITIGAEIVIVPNSDLGGWGGLLGTIGGVLICVIVCDILIYFAGKKEKRDTDFANTQKKTEVLSKQLPKTELQKNKIKSWVLNSQNKATLDLKVWLKNSRLKKANVAWHKLNYQGVKYVQIN